MDIKNKGSKALLADEYISLYNKLEKYRNPKEIAP